MISTACAHVMYILIEPKYMYRTRNGSSDLLFRHPRPRDVSEKYT